MKVFAVLFVCILTTSVVKPLPTEEEREVFLAMAQRCITESGASQDDVEGIIMHQPASSMEAKCLRACIMKEFGILNADGKFVKENAMNLAEIRTKGDPQKMALVDEITGVCKDLAVSDDHCEAGDQYGQCFIAESEKRGMVTLDF